MRPARRETSARMWLDMNTVPPCSRVSSSSSSADLDDPGGVKAIGGLVQDEQFGVMDQGFGQSQPLRIAVRKVARPPIGVRCQTHALDDLPDRFARGARVQAAG